MKLSYLLLFVVITTLILPTYNQTCALSSSNNDLLQSGQHTIVNTYNPSRREHAFTFPINFAVPSSGIQVAASASSFSAVATNGMDFMIWGGRGSAVNSGQIILLMNEDNTWSSIKVSYLASGRSDFVLGSFSAATYFLQSTSSNGVVTFPYIIPGWTAQSVSFTIIIEISGIKTSSNTFQASLSSVSFNHINGQITTEMALISSPPIQSVVITFIAFSKNSPISFITFNAATGSSLPYQFIGIERIQSGATTLKAYGFNSASQSGVTCSGSRCTTSCISTTACISSQGTVVGLKCLLCGSEQIVRNGQCINYNSCRANQVRNQNGICVCASGYSMVNQICYITCAVNAVIMNSQCSCIPGYVYSNAQGQCVQQSTITCRTNYIPVNGVCVCPSGYGIINNNCLVCPANSFVNNNGYCICNTGYTLDTTNLRCNLDCFANAYRNPAGQCVCINGYHLQNGRCIPQGQCTGILVWNGVQCACPTPQVKDSIVGGCTYCNTAGRMISGGVCVCTSTYYPTQTGCRPCVANSQYDSTQSRCVCNSGYISSGGSCVPSQNCPHNSYWNPTAAQCICNAAFQYVINGYCQTCPSNSDWNGKQCICNTGYSKQSNGQCVKDCVNGNWQGTSCVCWTGYYYINGVCQKCDPNSYYSNLQLTCVCNEGYFGTWNSCTKCHSSCKTCSAASASSCTSCPIGTPTNGVCSNNCGTGKFRNSNNQCQSCIANCDLCYTATSCTTCAAGYTRTSSSSGAVSCDAPSPTASHQLTMRGHVLGNKVIYQGVALNAMPVPIVTAGCAECTTLFLVEINSLFTSIVVTQQFVSGSQYWFIISFSYPTASTTVPTFEFTVKINPTHPYAQHFTAQDLAQQLNGSFNPSSFPTSVKTAASRASRAIRPNVRTFRANATPQTGGLTFTSQGSGGGSSSGITQSVIDQIFKN